MVFTLAVKYKDYYEILGVERNSSDAAIKRAYRKLARECHPDVNKDPGAQNRFQEISEAYEVLGDSGKRKRYDELGANWQQDQEFTPPPGWENIHFEFGGNHSGQDFGFSGQGGFSDFFESIFGDMMGGPSFYESEASEERPQRRTHDEAELQLSLEEAWRGGKKRFSVALAEGQKPRMFDLNIPPGIRDGAKLRLRDQGRAGDLLIRIAIASHPRFKVEGADLEMEIPLSPPQAVLGVSLDLQLMDGRAKLRIPPGTQPGKKFRLTGKGLKKPGGTRGDLYAVIRIVIPRNPTTKEKIMYKKLMPDGEEGSHES